MRLRSATLGALAVFLLGATVQSFLHTHLVDRREHTSGCADALASALDAPPAAAHARVLVALPDPPVPSTPYHRACAPCVASSAWLGVEVAAVKPPSGALPAVADDLVFGAAAAVLSGFDPRGPPPV